MTTQTELKPEQLPYANETALVNKLMALPGKFFARLGNLLATLSNAIEMRNRYVALDSLDDATLENLGITRATIPQIVAREAGLIKVVEAPVAHNSNERTIRPAA